MNITYKIKKKRGDISVLVTLLVSSILLIFLGSLSQKILTEARISRQNLLSQQAVQAALTGIDSWFYVYAKYPVENYINIEPLGDETKRHWPNSNPATLPDLFTVDGEWIVLDDDSKGTQILYRAEYKFEGSTPNKQIIAGKGRVVKNDVVIVERTIEKEVEQK